MGAGQTFGLAQASWNPVKSEGPRVWKFCHSKIWNITLRYPYVKTKNWSSPMAPLR